MTTENKTPNAVNVVALADTPVDSASSTNASAQNHIQDLSLSVKGLIRRLEYKYIIEGLGANWPVAIVPISGSFVADSKTANINVKAIFCPNFTLCPSGSADVLGYNRNYSYGTEKNLLFSTVRAKVSELAADTDFLYSAPTTLSCSNCLPVVGPVITLPDAMVMDNTTNNSVTITGVASGISPDTRYAYRYKVLDATWPVELYPVSGTVKSATEVLSVPAQLVFCEVAGNYDTDMCGVEKEKRATISLELDPLPSDTETVSILSVNTKLISNDMFAQCVDCVPVPNIKLNVNSLSNNANTPQTDTKTSVAGATATVVTAVTNSNTITLNSAVAKVGASVIGVGIPANTTVTSINGSSVVLSQTVSLTADTNLTFSLVDQSIANAMSVVVTDPSKVRNNVSVSGTGIPMGTLVTNINGNIVTFSKAITVTQGSELSFGWAASLADEPVSRIVANKITITSVIENLKTNRQYFYDLENIDSNWPLFVSEKSGVLSPTSESTTLQTIGEFCESVLLCPQNNPNIIPYSLGSGLMINQSTNTNNYAMSSFRLKLVDPAITGTYYSNNIKVYCDGCSQSSVPVIISSQVSDNPSCS